MAKKILCSETGCRRVVAHQLGDKTVKLKRGDQSVVVSGNNWSQIASCPTHPEHQTTISVNDGAMDTASLDMEDLPEDQEDKEDTGDNKGDDDKAE